MIRRFFLIAALFLLGLPQVQAYSDTAGYIWESSIKYITDAGFVRGYEDGTFRPGAKINRAEFTKIVIASRFTEPEYRSYTQGCFSDIPADQWYTPYICFAKAKGIVGGNPDGTFRPAASVNQAEALKILLLTYEQPISLVDNTWYAPYFESAKRIGMLYFAGGNEAAYLLRRGEMAYFTAWLYGHEQGRTVDQLLAVPAYRAPFSHSVAGTTHTVTMEANLINMKVLTGNSSIRSKECDFPHHCVAEVQAESFDSMVARSHKGLVVNAAFFDAYSLPLNGKNFHQISSDIVIDGIMKSMYGWDEAFGNGGMLAQLKDGSFRLFYPIRHWLQEEVLQGISNYPLVLLDGKIRSRADIGSYDENDAKFWITARRAGLGISADGTKLYYVSAQGTVEDLGAALQKAGAHMGFALDSGSSNAMSYEGKTIFYPGRNLTTAVEFYERE